MKGQTNAKSLVSNETLELNIVGITNPTVSISYNNKAYYYTGNNIKIKIPSNVDYIITFEESGLYRGPDPMVYHSIAFNTRTLDIEYYKDYSKCILCTYNITNSGDLSILYNITEVELIIINDSPQTTISTKYNFPSTGTYTIYIKLKGNIIPDKMFYERHLLTGVIIPDCITSIGTSAFDSCNLINLTLGNNLISIGANAFEWNKMIDIKIPDSVKFIGDWCFGYCRNATSLDLGNGVLVIGKYAFYDCESLGATLLYIPESVSDIGYRAFSITNVMGEAPFSGIIVNSNNKFYDCRNNCNAIIETATNTLLLGSKYTIIPDGVLVIGDYAFSWGVLGSGTFIIPNSVHTIKTGAFCTKALRKVDIGTGIKTIETDAFDYGWYCNTIICRATTPPTITDSSFSGTGDSATLILYVPKGCTEAYSSWIASGTELGNSGCTIQELEEL